MNTQTGMRRAVVNQVELNTERFLLRTLTEADVSERYLSWLEDVDAKKYITASSQTEGISDLRRYVAGRQLRDDVLFLGIFEKNTGRHIGNIKYEPVNREAGFAIMGVLIGEPDYRGKGVTTEVLKASALWLQLNCGIAEIILGVEQENHAAIRAYEKTGFVVEKTAHIKKISPSITTMVWRL